MKNPKINSNQIRLSETAIIGRLNVSGLLALAGILGPPILIVADYTAAFTSPGYKGTIFAYFYFLRAHFRRFKRVYKG